MKHCVQGLWKRDWKTDCDSYSWLSTWLHQRNELQSRNGGHTCDPDLEAGRHKFLTWILAWRSWGIVAMNPRRLRQGDLWVQGHLGQSKSQIQAWWYTPLIWATPSAGDLHKDIGRRKIHSLLSLTCQHICWNLLLQESWLFRRPGKTCSIMGLR